MLEVGSILFGPPVFIYRGNVYDKSCINTVSLHRWIKWDSRSKSGYWVC